MVLDRSFMMVLRSETRAASAQSFTLWQQTTKEIMRRKLSSYCLFAPLRYIVVIRAHPIRGESHIQRNATGEVATMVVLLQMFTMVNIKSHQTDSL